MSTLQNYLISLSFLVWGIMTIAHLIQHKRDKRYWLSSGIQIALIFVLALILHRYFDYFNDLQEMGSTLLGEGITLGGLYLSTALGILGHHIFVQIKWIHEKGKQNKLKWFPIIKPLAISPIIFISVLSQLEKMGAQAHTLTAVFMQFLLAFQSGFFWKTIFEQTSKTLGEQPK